MTDLELKLFSDSESIEFKNSIGDKIAACHESGEAMESDCGRYSFEKDKEGNRVIIKDKLTDEYVSAKCGGEKGVELSDVTEEVRTNSGIIDSIKDLTAGLKNLALTLNKRKNIRQSLKEYNDKLKEAKTLSMRENKIFDQINKMAKAGYEHKGPIAKEELESKLLAEHKKVTEDLRKINMQLDTYEQYFFENISNMLPEDKNEFYKLTGSRKEVRKFSDAEAEAPSDEDKEFASMDRNIKLGLNDVAELIIESKNGKITKLEAIKFGAKEGLPVLQEFIGTSPKMGVFMKAVEELAEKISNKKINKDDLRKKFKGYFCDEKTYANTEEAKDEAESKLGFYEGAILKAQDILKSGEFHAEGRFASKEKCEKMINDARAKAKAIYAKFPELQERDKKSGLYKGVFFSDDAEEANKEFADIKINGLKDVIDFLEKLDASEAANRYPTIDLKKTFDACSVCIENEQKNMTDEQKMYVAPLIGMALRLVGKHAAKAAAGALVNKAVEKTKENSEETPEKPEEKEMTASAPAPAAQPTQPTQNPAPAQHPAKPEENKEQAQPTATPTVTQTTTKDVTPVPAPAAQPTQPTQPTQNPAPAQQPAKSEEKPAPQPTPAAEVASHFKTPDKKLSDILGNPKTFSDGSDLDACLFSKF